MAAPASADPLLSTVYGLTIASGVPLGPPAPAGAEVDVGVDWVGGTGLEPSPASHRSRRIVEATGGWLEATPVPATSRTGTRLRFGYAGHEVGFDISAGGSRVAVSWTPGVPAGHAQTLLLTTVMGYLLHCQGRLALHASVVLHRGAAFVLAGDRGSGKSTTAAALVQRGCTAASDDVAALARGRRGWEVAPGPTGARLAPEARAALGVPATAAMPVWPLPPSMAGIGSDRLEDKEVVSLGEPAPAPAPLAGIFLLAPRTSTGAEPGTSAVPPVLAVPGLVAHLLTPAWLDRTVDRHRFAALADIARSTPVRTLDRPDSLAALPRLCDVVLAEMDRIRDAAHA